MWHAGVNSLRLGLRFALSVTVGTLVAAIVALASYGMARAAGTNISASICDPDMGSAITVSSPANDTVVNQPQVLIKGVVNNATQIEQRIDGQYNGTLPLDPEADSYELTLTLPEGTHTIELVANDVCGIQNATATLVVTYTPAAQPSVPGRTTPSTVNPDTNGGVLISGAPVGPVPADISSPPFAHMLDTLNSSLGLDATGQDGPGKSLARISLVLLGLGFIVFAGWFAGRLWSHGKKRFGAIVYTRPVGKWHLHKHGAINGFRVFGVLIMTSAFLL